MKSKHYNSVGTEDKNKINRIVVHKAKLCRRDKTLTTYHFFFDRKLRFTVVKKNISKHPYYISPIEIGLFCSKTTYLKSHQKAKDIDLQTDMK